MDIICHGTPHPNCWTRYLSNLCTKHKRTITDIASINFRDKQRGGWKNYSFTICFKDGCTFSQPHDDNLYMRAFLANYTLREACFNCKFKYPDGACADITLGDFWGIMQLAPHLDNDSGTTLVISRTPQGKLLLERACINYEQLPLSLNEVAKYNPALVRPSQMPSNYRQFADSLAGTKPIVSVMRAFAGRSFRETWYLRLARLKHRILNK